MCKKFPMLMTVLGMSLFLAACGDDSANKGSLDWVAETFDDLGPCTAETEGIIGFVIDQNMAYICVTGTWYVYENSNVLRSTGSEYDAATGLLTDLRDSNVYKTAIIGSQVWMVENLRYEDFINSSSLRNNFGCPEYSFDCSTNGYQYTWAAAIDSVTLASSSILCGDGLICAMPERVQGICPEGWHLPSYGEWQTLFETVGGTSIAGTALKSTSGWCTEYITSVFINENPHTAAGNGSDAYGFNVYPTRYTNATGYNNCGSKTFFWSSTQTDEADKAFHAYFSYYEAYVDAGYDSKAALKSVRCIKD